MVVAEEGLKKEVTLRCRICRKGLIELTYNHSGSRGTELHFRCVYCGAESKYFFDRMDLYDENQGKREEEQREPR